MRILIRLIPEKSCSYESHSHKLQGFFYSLFKSTPYEVLHNKPLYKHFCFSNLFPKGDLEIGTEKMLIFSSPDKHLVRTVLEKLMEKATSKTPINIGEMRFTIKEVKLLSSRLNSPHISLITATPIIIRIPEKNYEKYKIPNEYRKKRYIYWRPQYDFSPFIKQLEENIFKKYKEFYKKEIEEFPLFEAFKFNGMANPRIVIKGREYPLVGSYWEFHFSGLNHDRERRKILEFAMDEGFGERNTYGFGFVNRIK